MDMWLLLRYGLGLVVLGLALLSFWRAVQASDFFSICLHGCIGIIALGGAYLAVSPGGLLYFLLF